MKCMPAALSNFLVSVPRADWGSGIWGPGFREDSGQDPDVREPGVRSPGFGGSGLKMKMAKTLGGVVGLAVVSLAGVAFLDLHGAGNSLRGGSSTKPLSSRAAARRALLETVAYSTRQVNRRRLKQTAISCDKVDTFITEAMGCVYVTNPSAQSGNQAHCIFEAVVQHGWLTSDSRLVPLLERRSGILNSEVDEGGVTFPYNVAMSIAAEMRSICTMPVDGEDRRLGLSTMSQDTFMTVVTDKFRENEALFCLHGSIENSPACHDILTVLEIGMSVADLG